MSTAAVLLAIAALLLGALIGFLIGHTLTERRQQRDESRLRAAFDSVAGDTLRANSEAPRKAMCSIRDKLAYSCKVFDTNSLHLYLSQVRSIVRLCGT